MLIASRTCQSEQANHWWGTSGFPTNIYLSPIEMPSGKLMRKVKAIWICIVITLSGTSALAQKNTGTPQTGKKQPEPGLARPGSEAELDIVAILRRLDEILATTRDFKDDTLTVRIQARIADAIWPFDEPRARTYFRESFRTIDEIKPNLGSPASNASTESETKAKLRDDVIAFVSSRDLRLAQELLDSVSEARPETDKDQSIEDQTVRKALGYMDSALQSAESDPVGAIRLAQEGLNLTTAEIIFFKLSSLLETLRRRDNRRADDLFIYSLTVAAQDPNQSSAKFRLLADYVFPGFSSSGSLPTIKDQTKNNDGKRQDFLIRRFLSTVAGVMTRPQEVEYKSTGTEHLKSGIRASVDFELIQKLLPHFDVYLPELAPLLRSRLGNLQSELPLSSKPDLANAPGTDARDLTRAAENASQQSTKNALYLKAWTQSLSENDYELADSISQKIADKALRERLQSSTWFLAANAAIGREEFETANTYSERVTNCMDRATILSNLASAYYSKKLTPRAIGTIDAAHGTIGKCEEGLPKCRALLILLVATSKLDVSTPFDVLASLVQSINKATLTSERDSDGTNSVVMVQNLEFSRGLSALARADFDRTLHLTRSIERKDVGAFTEIALCREKLASLKEAVVMANEKKR